jgi:hypothetical protein
MTPRQIAAAARRAQAARIAQGHAATAAVLAANQCPVCGATVRRNLALTGWVQCAQYGAPDFRANAAAPSCSWQGFTA